MKQLLFMIVLTLAGTAGVFLVQPFLGVAVYYLFAVLRPQYLWEWSLPTGISWSYYVAMATILGAAFIPVSVQPVATRLSAAPDVRLGTSHKLLVVFGAWVGLTAATAFNTGTSFAFFIEFSKIVVMFIVSSLIVRNFRELWMLMVIAAGCLGYIAYEVNFLYLAHGYLGIYHNGYGGLDNNGAGLLLAMGVPLCFFVWEGSARPWRWVFLALIPLLIHAVLMTYSRGAMVAMIVAAPLMYIRARRRLLVMAGGIALALALPVLAGAEIQARFFTLGEYEVQESAQSRFGSWRAGWEMAKDHPILGFGPRNSNLFSQEYGADMEKRTIHSQYLQVAADSGFVGLGLYLLLLLVTWRGVRRVRRWAKHQKGEEATQVYSMAAGVEASLAVFCVGALFLSLEVFELPYLLLLIGAKLGVLYRQARPSIATDPQPVATDFWTAPPVPRRV